MLALTLLPALAVADPGHCDLALLHGKIWTENPTQPTAEAIAVTGNRIVEVGASSEIQKLIGPNTKVIDLKGRRVVPGFNDAHVHFYTGGSSLTSVELRSTRSAAEFRDKIAAFARTRPKGEWILNGSWDHESWQPANLPTHELIDGVTPDHPVFVNRSDGHMMLANALAMKLAGIDHNTRDVPGGVIGRDAKGNPTGIFKDAAKGLIEHFIPVPSQAQIIEAVTAAQRYAAENGVTSVQDMGVVGATGLQTTLNIIEAYQVMLKRDQLQIRIASHLPLPEWRRLSDAGISAGFGGEKITAGAVKGFADGSLGSSTAWFFQPFSDMPGSSGIPSDELVNAETMYRNVQQADKAGLQIAIHAIGDRANNTILNFYEKLEKQDGVRDRRLRIEHAQHLLAADIPRFGSLKVIASVQPYHCIDDGRWAEKRIGHERATRTYAFRSLLDAGVTLAFGSDWWVAPMSPLMGIYAASTRRTLDGQNPNGWIPEQKISVKQALHAYTVGSAYASSEEHLKGSLEARKLADLAVLSEDILSINPVDIKDVKVDLTIFDGKIIFERKL
jgi:predicted amidohydrolase YtcJ